MSSEPRLQTAEIAIAASPFSITAKVAVTPSGLLSIAALVGTILLATAVVVQAAKK